MKLETMIDWLSFATDIKIGELSRYLDMLKKQLDSLAVDFGKKLEAEAEQIENEQERDDFYEWRDDEYWNYKETFPRIFFNSFHVSAYALFESEIKGLLGRLGKKQRQVFGEADLKRNDFLGSASNYINRITSIDIKKYTSWQNVQDGKTLRNTIVHSNGILTKKHEIEVAKKNNILKETNIDVTSGRTVKNLSVSYEYSTSFISALADFFHALYKDMKAGEFL